MQYSAAHIDFETGSTTDLKKSGVYRYAEDPHTRVWGFRYRMDYEPLGEWRPGWPDPSELLHHIAMGGRVVAHNAAFERTIWNNVVRVKYAPHWPALRIEQQDCTMARAAAIAHPQGLDALCNVLQTQNRKDRDGHAIMLRMSRPRAYKPDGTLVWWDEYIDANMTYCGKDVLTEHDIDEVVPPLTDAWRKVWEFDQTINDRGVRFDRRAVEVCASLAEIAKKEADKTMRQITGRAVPKCTNVAKIIEFLNARGLETESLKKGDQDDLIYMADLRSDPIARDVIELRKFSSKTSTAKYGAMLKCMSADDNIRGLLNFHGASTGRWAGRLVQTQNFPRVDPDDEVLETKINFLHELIRDGYSPKAVYDIIEAAHGPLEPLLLLSKALRSMIVAVPGKKLVGGDFSNIEGRVNAWLAGEQWKLDAFQAYDDKIGPDLYKVAYARSFGVPVEQVGKGEKRQIGKVQELACGYQGSIGAYITMGATYNVNPYDLSAPVQSATSIEQWEATKELYNRKGTNRYQLQEREWTAIKIVVDNWRAAHPNIVQSWWNVQDAAIEAVATPGTYVGVANNRIHYYCDTRYLWCVLPSGRMLCYSSPELVRDWVSRPTEGKPDDGYWKNTVYFWGEDKITRQWVRKSLYGGLQWENIVQAVACDILVDAMFRVEAAGFPVVMTVHDEILAMPETWTGLGELEFKEIMAQKAPIYEGLPMAVSAWEGDRYMK